MSGLGATHQSWAAAPLALEVCRAEDAHRRHHAHGRERSEGEGPGGWHDREEVVDGMAIAIDGAWPYARRRVGDARARAAWSRIRGSVASGRGFRTVVDK